MTYGIWKVVFRNGVTVTVLSGNSSPFRSITNDEISRLRQEHTLPHDILVNPTYADKNEIIFYGAVKYL